LKEDFGSPADFLDKFDFFTVSTSMRSQYVSRANLSACRNRTQPMASWSMLTRRLLKPQDW
jgi:hypothetical protein